MDPRVIGQSMKTKQQKKWNCLACESIKKTLNTFSKYKMCNQWSVISAFNLVLKL